MRAAGFALAIVLSSAVVAAADPVTFQFSGTVTEFFPDPNAGFNASPGDRFVAFLTLQSTLRDFDPSPQIGAFRVDDGSIFSMNVGTGSFRGTSGGFADLNLDAANDIQARFGLDDIQSRFTDETGHTRPITVSALFGTGGHGRPFLATDAFPTAAELNRASRRFLTLGTDCCETPFFTGSIQTVSGGPVAPTPEPASLGLLAAGLAAAAFTRRRTTLQRSC